MPLTFPSITGGSPAKYPLPRTRKFRTGQAKFCDGTEQRWTKLSTLTDFVLEYKDLHYSDLVTLRDFFYSTLAEFDSTWSITLDSVTYTDCCFTNDDFDATENKPDLWSVKLGVRQTLVQ